MAWDEPLDPALSCAPSFDYSAAAYERSLLFCRILDNLPVAIVKMRENDGKPFKTYERGFPVGRLEVRPVGARDA